MPTPIYNTTGKDDADAEYHNKVRSAVMDGLKRKPAPKGSGYYDRVVKRQEDGEEG